LVAHIEGENFENRVLRSTFVPRRDEVTEERRRLHNEELYAMYFSPNIIRVIKIDKTEIDRACCTYGGEETCIQGFGGET
jgi:polynucleotide 5'-kinase involved in rRNA processing